MFERYTERARRVLFFARYEASQFGNRSITPEHLLLGLLREGKGLTSRLLARSNLTIEELRDELVARIPVAEKFGTSVEVPFDPQAKRVLQFGAEEADRLLHNDIGTEHLLLGVLREETSGAAQVLLGRGLSLESVRYQIVYLLNASIEGRLQSIDLKALIARTVHTAAHRLELSPELDRTLSVVTEPREVDAFVLGVRPDANLAPVSVIRTSSPRGANSSPALGPFSFSGLMMPDFAVALEQTLGRPVIDETGLEKRYDIEVSGPHENVEALAAALEREMGLTLTRARREIQIITVR